MRAWDFEFQIQVLYICQSLRPLSWLFGSDTNKVEDEFSSSITKRASGDIEAWATS